VCDRLEVKSEVQGGGNSCAERGGGRARAGIVPGGTEKGIQYCLYRQKVGDERQENWDKTIRDERNSNVR